MTEMKNKDPLYQFLRQTFSLSFAELLEFYQNSKKPENATKTRKQIFEELAQRKQVVLPEDFWGKLELMQLSCTRINPEMVKLVQVLKKNGYKVVCFSNVMRSSADLIRKLGGYTSFDQSILSHEIGYKKPDPKAYDVLLKAIDTLPNKCLFIDDKEENILAAQKKGIHGIHFTSVKQLKKELKNYQINFR